jgi:hypothetical protein
MSLKERARRETLMGLETGDTQRPRQNHHFLTVLEDDIEARSVTAQVS